MLREPSTGQLQLPSIRRPRYFPRAHKAAVREKEDAGRRAAVSSLTQSGLWQALGNFATDGATISLC